MPPSCHAAHVEKSAGKNKKRGAQVRKPAKKRKPPQKRRKGPTKRQLPKKRKPPQKRRVISRAEARKKGLKRYFTGKRCKYGHRAERRTKNWTCDECERNRRRGAKRRARARPLFITWQEMNNRCYNPKNEGYADYGGRGLKVHLRWRRGARHRRGYQNFIADMAPKPAPHLSLERLDNDDHYRPWNVVWATAKEQNANQRPRRNGLGITGVSRHGSGYRARIPVGSRTRNLGTFRSVKAAVAAYKKAERARDRKRRQKPLTYMWLGTRYLGQFNGPVAASRALNKLHRTVKVKNS
jgi:hypothetical protein